MSLLRYKQKCLPDGGCAYDGGDSAPAQSAPTQQTVTQTSIPEYARPYAESLLGRAQSLTVNDPYRQYSGERIAGFSPMQQQAFQGIAGMQVAPQVGAGTGLAGAAGLGGLGAQQQYTQQATSPAAMQSYMSPYMQNVVDFQKQEAIRDYGRQLPQLGAGAAKAGAYGGSRMGIMESEAQRNLQNQLAGIQSAGSQKAYEQGLQSLQYGSNLGMQGLGLAGQAAGTLGQLGQTQYGQQMGINTAQQQAGAQQQALEQQRLSTQYQDFLNQQNYPYKQLGFMSDILRGMPLTQNAQSIYQAPPSTTNQLMAYGLGAYGLSNLFGGKKAGGPIKAYKRGGRVKSRMGAGLAELGLYQALGGKA